MKKLVCLILMMLLVIPRPVAAEEALAVYTQGFQTQTNKISVDFNTNADKKLEISQLKVTLGKQELKIKDLTTAKAFGEGMTYLFLVDVSGSIKDEKQSEMKEILMGIANQLSDKDNAAVMLVGNDYKTMAFVNGKDKLKKQIDEIKTSSQDTNLYAAIINALGILNTDKSVQTKRCLVILSDGKDDYTKGYTKDEVNTKIKDANIPVYTVALLGKNASKDLIESAKVLGSFARQSDGGLDTTLGLDDTSDKKISEKIVQSMKDGYILTADTSSLKLTEDQSYLEITVTTDKGKASDGYTIDSSLIKVQLSPTPNPEKPTVMPTKPAVVPTKPAVAETKTSSGIGLNRLIIPVIIGAVFLLLVVIIIIIRIRRKSKNTSPIQDTLPDQVISDEVKDSPTITPKQTEQMVLYFTKVGLTEGETYTVKMDGELIIGRSAANAQFVFEKDDLLSSQHCKITYKDKKLYLEDLNSTNGTFVNGIPVLQAHILEKDDIILIGSMELRINW